MGWRALDLLRGGSLLNRLIRESYKLLNLITYFTAGEKEVRAWTVLRGSKAPQPRDQKLPPDDDQRDPRGDDEPLFQFKSNVKGGGQECPSHTAGGGSSSPGL